MHECSSQHENIYCNVHLMKDDFILNFFQKKDWTKVLYCRSDCWTTFAGVTRNEDKRSQTKERDVKKHIFWHKMLIYYNNMYVLMYFTFEKRFMWFFSNRDHPCSFNVKNIIKKMPFADQLTWSHTIFRCYLVTFKIIPPPVGYSELFQKISRYWTIFWRGIGGRVRVHFICTAAVLQLAAYFQFI